MKDKISTESNQLFADYIEQLEKESERGTVIVSAALMDEALAELIKAKLVPSPGKDKDDELFVGSYAPLGTFSARIDFAYRLGIIAPSTRSSLHLLRKLRNDFAHSSLHMSFQTNSVKSRIKELFKLNKPFFDVLWDVIIKQNNPHVVEMTKSIESKKSIDHIIKVAGQRGMFEILVSLTAYSLKQRNQDIEPLKSWADRTKKT